MSGEENPGGLARKMNSTEGGAEFWNIQETGGNPANPRCQNHGKVKITPEGGSERERDEDKKPGRREKTDNAQKSFCHGKLRYQKEQGNQTGGKKLVAQKKADANYNPSRQ